MNVTQQDYEEAQQQHVNAIYQLNKHQHGLALAEKQLANERSCLDELQKSVERRRETVNQLQASVDLCSHRCLEIQVQLNSREAAGVGR